MKWTRRGDGLAVAAMVLGGFAAWTATFAAVDYASRAAGRAALGSITALATVARAVAETAAAQEGGVAEGSTAEAAGPGPVAALVREGVSFRAASLGSADLIQGDYGGRLTHDGDGFRLTIPVAEIRFPGMAGGPPARLGGISLSLVEYTSSGTRVVRRGKVHPVRQTIQPGGSLWLDDVVLELEGVSEFDAMLQRWLVIEHHAVGPWSHQEAIGRMWAPASAGILVDLFGWEEYGGC